MLASTLVLQVREHNRPRDRRILPRDERPEGVIEKRRVVDMGCTSSTRRIDHRLTEFTQAGLETMASLPSSPLYSSKRVMGLSTLPFTTVEDDP